MLNISEIKDKEKNKIVNKKKTTLIFLIIVIILIIAIIVIHYSKAKNAEKIYDNIDNYDYVSIKQEDITINGITFSDFRYKTSKDAQVFFMKIKNNTGSAIVEERNYQLTLYGETYDVYSNQVFDMNNLEQNSEQEISIAVNRSINHITGFNLSEY